MWLAAVLGPDPVACLFACLSCSDVALPSSLKVTHLPHNASPTASPPPPRPVATLASLQMFPVSRLHGVHVGHLFHLLRNNSQHYGQETERVPSAG